MAIKLRRNVNPSGYMYQQRVMAVFEQYIPLIEGE